MEYNFYNFVVINRKHLCYDLKNAIVDNVGHVDADIVELFGREQAS